ncbi:unnamed protein product [Phytophthora lilii]|uniref:Succinate-semialdehyde dehydrogenase, mitochondrial n=1 Tax=Phytophthora lilii TaxID=2077276 RepID=A0A9W6TPM4_9STRA|nr:unnamed protein product [Phytophthora lilii]
MSVIRWKEGARIEFDYVVVGGGSAGCVLANRLSADPSNSVLLVETGPRDRGLVDSIRLAMPALLPANLIDDRYNWRYVTEPQRHLDGRRLTWPRGRVLGGSSWVNAMIYNRGHALDYDSWQDCGAEGWSYADCLPYFKKAQTHALGGNDYRGADGPLHVIRRLQRDQPWYQAFIDAAVQAGYPSMATSRKVWGGWITRSTTERCSASAAYLSESVLARENLTVLTDTFVNKLLFEGKKAVGVEVEPSKTSTEPPKQVRAMKKVILSGGAVNSPQLMMSSGVGDAQHLKEIGPNYLDTEDDRVAFATAVRLTHEVLQQAFDEFRGDAISPFDQVQSDAEIDAWVRQNASTDYHPSSTNRMGLDTDPNTVVDAQARVHGLEGLRDMTGVPTAQLSTGLASITRRQYQPLLSKLKRPDLVNAQGFVNGKWVEGHSNSHFTVVGKVISPEAINYTPFTILTCYCVDPATEQEIARVVDMGEEDTRDAIAAAVLAQKHWKKTTPPVRAKLLKDWAAAISANTEDLAIIGSMECGKPLPEAKWELEFAVGVIEYFSHEIVRSSGFIISPGEPSQKVLVMKEPVGVCGIVTPWNFPYAILGLSLGPPLAAGCTTVVKPAGETPLSMLALAKLSEEVGFPPGIINVVTAKRERSEEVGRVLTSSSDVRKITFAGSTQVGKWLMRHSSETVKSLSLELGGNAPFIVFEDANIEKALNGLIRTKFANTGQACIASNRIFIHNSIYESFATKVVERVQKLKMGFPLEDGVQLGPLIGPSAVKKVTGLVEDAVVHGAKVLVGGKPSELGGNFYEATVLTDVNASMRISREEIFGPVVPLFAFSSEEEVVQYANNAVTGLAGYFYTQNVSRIFRVASELECGMVGVNSELVTHVGAPFGGVKESGIGREGSAEGLSEYLETKMVCIGGL